MTDHPTATDWRGNPYTVGSTILYPRASGRSVEMQEATVLAIVDKERERYSWAEARSVTETIRTVRVQPVRSSRFTYGGASNATTIHNVENITAVAP